MYPAGAVDIPALPDGWDYRLDPLTQKFYFIDHNRRTTQWKHPVTEKVYMQSGNYGPVVECPRATKNQVHHKLQTQQQQNEQQQQQPNHHNQVHQKQQQKQNLEGDESDQQNEKQQMQPDITVVAKVLEKVHNLQPEVERFAGTSKDKEYTRLMELLEQLILELDAVDPQGREEIRAARKSAVIEIQALMSRMDSALGRVQAREGEPARERDEITPDESGTSTEGSNLSNAVQPDANKRHDLPQQDGKEEQIPANS